MADQQVLRFYIGSYTEPDRPFGIGLYTFDRGTGEVALVEQYSGITNASYLALNKARTKLYAVNEAEAYKGMLGGSVLSFDIEPQTGRMSKRSEQPTHGTYPCYISLDETERVLFAANYMSGSVTVYPVREDGTIGEYSQLVQHEGPLGPNKARQEGPHAHSLVPAPGNRYAISADLGLDRLIVSTIDPDGHRLIPHGEAALQPGAGPRHLVYNSDNRFVYVVNELDCTVTVISYEAESGALAPIHSISTLPEDFTGENTCADIHLSPDGRHLYASNRGHDSIAVYEVDGQQGTLSLIQIQPTLGRTPRNFALTPEGDYVLAANQDSGTVTVFRIDPDSGMLRDAGQSIQVMKPVCIQFI